MAGRVNWRQAVAEVALILVAAAVALGVDSWVDGRQNASAERRYLIGLRSDFVSTDSAFRANVRATAEQQEHIRRFIDVLRAPPRSVASDSLGRMVRKAFLWLDFVPVLATYRDLVGSGELSLLRSDSLRVALAEFESYVESIRPYNAAALEQWNLQVTPYYIENFDVTELYGSSAPLHIGDLVAPAYDLGAPVDRVRSSEDAYWSREFLNLLAIRAVSLGDAIALVEPAIDRAGTILRLIDKSLERLGGPDRGELEGG